MITESELIAKRIAGQATATDEAILKDLIETHDTREMQRGVKYYNNENDIKNRRIYYYDANGNKHTDDEAINHRIPHNWHKLLVDQKVSYLLGKPVVIDADPEAFAEVINDWLDEEWDDTLQELGKGSSNKGVEYLHPFIDEEGNFDYTPIPGEQCIPIYDTDYERNLVSVIRYYPYWVNGRESLRAEWWDKEQVTYYINDGGNYRLEMPEEGRTNPDSHFYYNGQGYGWGKVPFIEFRNNEEKHPDLKFYKEIIDTYDLIMSNRSNTIEDIQKIFYVLKGYDGTSLAEFNQNLRYYRAAKVSEDGGIDTVQGDVPVEAEDSTLDRMEENIFLFGQGVNIKTDKFGQSPSGVALKFLFHLLDLKSNIMARKFSKGIKKFIWFLTEYLAISNKYAVPQNALDTVKITFSKSMPLNELEMVQMAQASKGIISDPTVIANHPWVEDANQEKEWMEENNTVDLDEDESDDLNE